MIEGELLCVRVASLTAVPDSRKKSSGRFRVIRVITVPTGPRAPDLIPLIRPPLVLDAYPPVRMPIARQPLRHGTSNDRHWL